MLITLPGPGASVPPAIDIEVVEPAANAASKAPADPATTSALPQGNGAPSAEQAASVDASSPPADGAPGTAWNKVTATTRVEPSPVEVPPDDMPQQIAATEPYAHPAAASPVAGSPRLANLPPPEPLAQTQVVAPALAPSAPDEVHQVTFEPDPVTTSSIVPIEESPAIDEPNAAAEEASAAQPAHVTEKPETALEQAPEVARADPKEKTPAEESSAKTPAETEGGSEVENEPTPPRAAAKSAAPSKTAAKPAPKAKTTAKAASKPAPHAAKKRQAATVKQMPPQTRRVVRKPQPPLSQGIMSLFSLRPPAARPAASGAVR
jgi:hypothetical protein